MRLLAIILSTFVSVFATSQDRTSGIVVDMETKEGLPGAHIYLLNDWRVGTTTDPDGFFQVDIHQTPNEDSLVISFLGYHELIIPVMNLPDTILLLAREMAIEEVVVVSSPLISEEFRFEKITKIDIYTNPAAKADPILAVNSMPSATTTDESANISLRGSSPAETGVFLNNVPIYDAARYSQLNGIGTFSLFNTSIIKEVTVFPGNPPLEYGNATSGIISLVTDDRVLRESSNSSIISLANVGYSRDQRLSENQSIKFFTNWQPSGPIKNLNREALENIQSFNSADLGAYWYGSRSGWTWKVYNYLLTESYAYRFRHPSFQGIFDQSKTRDFFVAGISHQFKKSELQINSGGSFSEGRYAYSSANFEVNNRDLFLGLTYHRTGRKLSSKYGISLDRRVSAVEGIFHEHDFALGPDHPTLAFEQTAIAQSVEAFRYYKFHASDRLAIGAGIRSNIPVNSQQFQLARQINLSYLMGSLRLVVGAGHYFKNGLSENSGGKLATESDQLSLDIHFDKKGFNSSVSLFTKRSIVNDSEGHVNGAEIYGNWLLGSKLSGSASLTWLNAQMDQGRHPYDISYFIRSNLSYSPTTLWTIELNMLAREGAPTFRVAEATFDTELSVFEPTAFQDARLGDYFNLSASVSRVIAISDNVGLVAFASLANLTDHKNVRQEIYNVDYTLPQDEFFSKRTGYFGFLLTF